ncbi:hypothetical protein MIV049R [Invertebrate iridescent virus 3]|uniref:Uncharacterized protein 049R n=1 Tax=Invertebrate iridescent virus 3 TaxID=345201 RepID=049R_IIV3|nr:hypothetical protein MIV049R [Invertebrate iridescent virus 3]Q197B1.1 RecName: Full=Uncharacterized protein 049R [Invertebrate iridescent virus 3]ABF82079.1 hypothetical protein MIV049R [Invertebrate iridescent virus 3]
MLRIENTVCKSACRVDSATAQPVYSSFDGENFKAEIHSKLDSFERKLNASPTYRDEEGGGNPEHYETLSQEINDLQSQIENLSLEVENLQGSSSSPSNVAAALAELSQSIRTIKEQLEANRKERYNLTVTVANLTAAVNAAKKTGSESTTATATTTTNYETQLKAFEAQIKALDNQLQTQKNLVQTTSVEAKNDRDSLRKTIEVIRLTVKTLQDQVESQTGPKKRRKSPIENQPTAGSELATLTTNLTFLTQRVEKLSQGVATHTTAMFTLEETMKKVHTTLQEATASNTNNIDAIRTRVQELADKIALFDQVQYSVGYEMAKKNPDSTKLRTDLDSAISTVNEEKKSLLTVKDSVQSLKTQLDELKRTLENDGDVSSLRQTVHDMASSIRDETATIYNKINALEEGLKRGGQTTTTPLTQLQTRVEEIDKTIVKWNNQHGEWTTRLNKLEAGVSNNQTLMNRFIQQVNGDVNPLKELPAELETFKMTITNTWAQLNKKFLDFSAKTDTSVDNFTKKFTEIHPQIASLVDKMDQQIRDNPHTTEKLMDEIRQLKSAMTRLGTQSSGKPIFSINTKSSYNEKSKKTIFGHPGIIFPETVKISSIYITLAAKEADGKEDARLFELTATSTHNNITSTIKQFEKKCTEETILEDYNPPLVIDAQTKLVLSCNQKVFGVAIFTLQYS